MRTCKLRSNNFLHVATYIEAATTAAAVGGVSSFVDTAAQLALLLCPVCESS